MRLPVADLPASKSLGDAAIAGKIEAGAVQNGSKLVIMPSGETATVKTILTNGEVRILPQINLLLGRLL